MSSGHETFEDGGRAADAAMYELMNTPPTTLAGMRAIIQYLVDWDNDSGYYYLPTLLRSPLLGGLIGPEPHTSEGGFRAALFVHEGEGRAIR